MEHKGQKIPAYFVAKGILVCVMLAMLAAFFIFSVFYLASGYDGLKQWYFSMNGCFYRHASWTTDFFTPAVKSKGNAFAAAGMVISLCLFIYLLARRRQYFLRTDEHTGLNAGVKWYLYVPVVLAGIAAWFWGNSIVKPGPDEIFSAVNCAELPTFQAAAYYMLPNNHIYFNVVNSIIYHCLHTDVVISGRVLSLIAYCSMVCVVFGWFAERFGKIGWAYIAVLPVMLQFTPWAFGFQARGYEWQLLCGWVAFQTIFSYLETGDPKHLRINTIFCVAGFALIPTYLYYYAAQVVFVLIMQISRRRIDIRYWKHVALCVASVFLLYLPALCFSGEHALTANDYVKKAQFNTAFLPAWLDGFKFYLSLVFSSVFPENNPFIFILCLLPLLLVLSSRKGDRTILLFYITFWAAWAGISLYMQRLPFARNLIWHYSTTMMVVVYTVYTIIDILAARIDQIMLSNALRAFLFGGPILVLTIFMAWRGSLNANYFLYFVDVNNEYVLYNREIDNIPPGSTVACSEERYCFYYYCRKKGYHISRCPQGNEDYYVKSQAEQVPENIAHDYLLLKIGEQGDEIYRHK